MGLVSLLEITAATDSLGTETVLRFSSGKGYNHPSAPGFYQPRIKQAANIKRSIFDDLRTFGASKISYGESVLKNNDGVLDYLKDYGYGRTINHLIGDEDGPYEDFQKVMDGVVEQPSFNLADFNFRYRDRMQELELPASPEGQDKPRSFGVVPYVTPVLVDETLLIYGVNFDKVGSYAPIHSFNNIYDGAVVIIPSGTDHPDLASLEAATIASGRYDTCLALGLFRLGSQAIKAVTCDVTEGATAADRYPGGILKRLLLDAGVDSGDISSSDITALNMACPYETGIYITTETYRAALDKIAPGGRCWYGPDNSGVYRIQQLNEPAGSPAATLKRFTRTEVAKASDADIISFSRLVSNDQGRGVPACRVTVKYGKNWTVQSAGELNEDVDEARRAWLAKEFRTVTASNDSVKLKYPLAPELTFETLLTTEVDAQALCDALLALYSQLWDLYEVKVKLSPSIATTIDLGSTVKLQFNRFGLALGKLFNVLSLEYNAQLKTLTSVIWGLA